MATPPENMVLRTVYLPKALDLRLKSLAFAREQTKNELVRELVQEALAAREAKGERSLAEGPKVKITTKSSLQLRAKAAQEPAQSRRRKVKSEPVVATADQLVAAE